jgi:hypothetical protein
MLASALRKTGPALSLPLARGLSGQIRKSKPVVAIVGATGAVGQEFLRILEERNFPMTEVRWMGWKRAVLTGGQVGLRNGGRVALFVQLKLMASSRSAGRKYKFAGNELTVEELTDDSFRGVDIALFSAGGAQSKRYVSDDDISCPLCWRPSSAARRVLRDPCVRPPCAGSPPPLCKRVRWWWTTLLRSGWTRTRHWSCPR